MSIFLPKFGLEKVLMIILEYTLASGGACAHFLLAAVPEVQQSVVLVGTEVCEVFEQAVSKPLITQHTCPPGFGKHCVVSPVVASLLLSTEWPLDVGGG